MIKLENVSASYGQGHVITDISLQVRPGEICSILGANGAGKTTILKTIMGYLPSVTGTITAFGDKSLRGLPTDRVARMGLAYVPEGRGILYSLTVRENLLVGAMARKGRDAGSIARSMDGVLERFPMLVDRLDQHAGLLSGGQQQMLAIGRALIASPRVLLLDEPSLGLAPLVRREISEILLSIKEMGDLTVLLVEQDIKLAQRCSDFAYVLRRGRFIQRMGSNELADRDRLRSAYLGRDAELDLKSSANVAG